MSVRQSSGGLRLKKSTPSFSVLTPAQNFESTSIRFRLLSDTAAIEEGNTLVEVPPAAATIGRYMAVHVKVDGKWQMASVRDALVETAAASARPCGP